MGMFFSFLLSLSTYLPGSCTQPPCCDPARQMPITERRVLLACSARLPLLRTLPAPVLTFLFLSLLLLWSSLVFESPACLICFLAASCVSSQPTPVRVPPCSLLPSAAPFSPVADITRGSGSDSSWNLASFLHEVTLQ